MQQVVHRDNAGAERPLGIRVGVSTGEATKEADDYFGDPVIEAARLCAKAGSGQILVTELVRATAGRRSNHAFTSLGELELKGLPEPIETLRGGLGAPRCRSKVGRNRPAAGPAGAPSRGRGDRPGRGTRAARGRAQNVWPPGPVVSCVLISGEPGQGKTTIVSELARRAHLGEATVLFGRCDEELGTPYRPFAEALGHLVTHAPEAMLRTHVAAHGGELARMVPALGQRLGGLPAPRAPTPTPSATSSTPPPWLSSMRRAPSTPSWCSSTTCTGPTSPASSCSATWWPTRPPPGCW